MLRQTLTRIRERAIFVLFVADSSLVEVLLMLAYAGWSYILLRARPDLFANTPSYQAMRDIAPQTVWGCLFAGLAIFKLVGVFGDLRLVRAVGAFLGLVFWSFIATMFVLTPGSSTGIVIYGILAFISLLVLQRHVAPLLRRLVVLLTRRV